jgi:uncharacterized membrane protein
MRRFCHFLLATIVRGLLFLAPIVLIALLAREGYQMLRHAFHPLARLLPAERVAGMLAEDFLTVLAIILVLLVAGLFVSTGWGRLISSRLEQEVLYRVPGYLIVRGAVGNFPGLNGDARPKPAMVETADGWAFALVVEWQPRGFCTVFLPDAPTPTSGAVRVVEASRVRPLDAPIFAILGCLTRSGTGAGAIAGQLLDCPREGTDGLAVDDRPGKS